MRFFKKCSSEEYEAQCKRARATSDDSYMETLDERRIMQAQKVSSRREGARQRQQKRRAKTRRLEIESGTRSPGGTKRKQKVSFFPYYPKHPKTHPLFRNCHWMTCAIIAQSDLAKRLLSFRDQHGKFVSMIANETDETRSAPRAETHP